MPRKTLGTAKPKDQIVRLPDGRFQTGEAPKSPGRPKGVMDTWQVLSSAVAEFEGRHVEKGLPCRCEPHCTTFMQHLLSRALKNDAVLIQLTNKLVPNAADKGAGERDKGHTQINILNIHGLTKEQALDRLLQRVTSRVAA